MCPENMEKKHYVLVHGACHGAWSWYKLKPRLESAGHLVSVLDMAASGIHPAKIEDLASMSDYSEPLLKLLASLPPNEKVVLVGHSFAGMNLAVAIDRFPDKVSLAVFLAAFMPDTQHKPSYVLEQYNERTPAEEWTDIKFRQCGSITTLLFGPESLSSKIYQLSPTEDLELAKALIRPGSLFLEDLSKVNNFSEEGYGSVPRGYIVCDEDKLIPLKFQQWMIQNFGVDETVEIKGADHMAMLSKPQELCHAGFALGAHQIARQVMSIGCSSPDEHQMGTRAMPSWLSLQSMIRFINVVAV
ncbi:salicylic acid-binding protein 2 [Neltuma alba]|uniref:salicylic acid-binding protein 2 n=1 Tax=Neltuma alba TaxID=207710 RepID=UPI0010A38536|nr:salicylic acid-binding protein 2-like [Prosopis alba]